MTSTNTIPDSHTYEDWEAMSNNLRNLAADMGIRVSSCHPGEAEACGASFVAHSSYYLGVLGALLNRKKRYWPDQFDPAHRY